MNRPLYFALLLSSLALLAAVFLRGPGDWALRESGGASFQPRQGPAPIFSLPGIDGAPVELEKLRGRWVLLNFWATWCDPCIEELPQLAALAAAAAGRPLSLVLAAADEDREEVVRLAARFEELARRENLETRVTEMLLGSARLVRGQQPGSFSAGDPGGDLAHRYGTEMYPETYLIDPAGALRAVFIGPQPWSTPEMQQELWRWLSGEAPRTETDNPF